MKERARGSRPCLKVRQDQSELASLYFYVHNYSQEASMLGSNAVVVLNCGAGEVIRLDIPQVIPPTETPDCVCATLIDPSVA